MSKSEVAVAKPKSLAKGLVAGMIGGLAGAVAMTLSERLLSARSENKTESPKPAAEAIRWDFGAAIGAAYGALAEYYPAATSKDGATFGMALEALTQEVPMPALGLAAAAPAKQTTTLDRASGLTASIVYGLTTEWVRRVVRRVL